MNAQALTSAAAHTFADPDARLDALAELSQRLLAAARARGASQAEVSCSEDAGLNVNVRMGEVETVESTRDRGIGVTVYFGQRKGSASTADLREESLESTVEHVRADRFALHRAGVQTRVALVDGDGEVVRPELGQTLDEGRIGVGGVAVARGELGPLLATQFATQVVGRIGGAALCLERIPQRHLAQRNAHRAGGVAAQMLVREEQHALAAGERPFQHGVRIGRGAYDAAVASAERLQRGG